MGTSNLRGSTTSGDRPLAGTASSSRSSAFFVTTSRSFSRRGFSSASRTACRPNSQIVSRAVSRRARSLSTTQSGFFIAVPLPPVRSCPL